MIKSRLRSREHAASRNSPIRASTVSVNPQQEQRMQQQQSTAKAASAAKQEAKGQDIQAVDYYQKGIEIAHNASTFDDHLRSIENFSIAIAIRNNQPRFFFARGNAFRSINEYESAAKDYSMAISFDDRSAMYYANRGACYRKLNRPIEALEDLTAAIEMDTKKGTHYFNRALVLYEAGFHKEAIIDFTKAIDEGTSGIRIESRALQYRGNCHRRLGNLTKCIEDMQHAIKLDSRNSTTYSQLAQAYFECGDYDNAIAHYTNAIQLNDTNASYYSNRGLCYYRKGDKFARACLADFNKCIKLDGKDPQAYYHRGSIRLALALDLFKLDHADGTPATPEGGSSGTSTSGGGGGGGSVSSSFLPSSGTGLSAEDQLDAAYADIEMAWTLCPNGTKYQIGLAMITQLKKQFDRAKSLFQSIDAVEHQSVLVQYHLALTLHLQQEYEPALVLLTDAIDAIPNEPLLYEARALVLQDIGEHPLALEDYTIALGMGTENPNRAVHLYLRSVSLLRMEQFDAAIAGCSDALSLVGGYLDPQPALEVGLRNTRAMAYRGLGQYEDAISDLALCIKLQPGNDIFHFHRGLCLMEIKQYADALPDFHYATIQNPTDATILYYIGLCYYHEHKPRECLPYLHQALTHAPPPTILCDLYYHIGLSYAHEHDHIHAIQYFTSAIDHMQPTDNQSLLLMYVHERAKVLQLEKYYDEAIDDFSFVIRHNPHNAHAYFRRAFAYKALGKLQEAASDFQTAKLLDPANPMLLVNYKELRDIDCVVLCPPGMEKAF